MAAGSRDVAITVSLQGLPRESAFCQACYERLEERISLLTGISRIEVSPEKGQVILNVKPDANVEAVLESTERIIREVASGFSHETFRIGGMDCPQCAEDIRARVAALNGVFSCSVDFAAARMSVEYDACATSTDAIASEVRRIGYSARRLHDVEQPEGSRDWIALGSAVAVYFLAGVLGAETQAGIALFALAMLVSGARMLRSGLLSLLRFDFTTNALMTIAVIGATGIGELSEAALVTILYRLGNNLQSRAVKRTRAAIGQLVASVPKTAQVVRGEVPVEVPVAEVVPGERVHVRSFSAVPVDGVVQDGTGYVDTSLLTGESEPQAVAPGSKVLAGSSTTDAPLTLVATKRYQDTTFARTLALIEEGDTKRAHREQVIERLSRWYTPTVIVLAITYALVAIGFRLESPSGALHRSFWLLMVACPCALVISIPVAVTTAIAAASRVGALVKGGGVLEALERVRTWVFDKTGTLTYSRLVVQEVVLHRGTSRETALELAGSLAAASNHPVARAIAREAKSRTAVQEPREIPGAGIEGTVNGKRYRLGSAAFTDAEPSAEHARAVHLSDEDGAIATFRLGELVKVEARAVLADLQQESRLVLLSGDHQDSVRQFADALGVQQFQAAVSPVEKAEAVRALKDGGPVAMVGDGVNDVAALLEADVGIAMGAAGTDAALESADVIVLNDDLRALSALVRLSRALRRVVIQNIVFSLFTKALLVAAGVIWPLSFWIAVAGDLGVSLLVTANSLRLRSLPQPSDASQPSI